MSSFKRDWISKHIRDMGKRKKDLAEALGLPHTRISDIINGTRALKVTEVKRFADFMNMTTEEVLCRFSGDCDEDENSFASLVKDEKEMIQTYRGLSESGKQKFHAFVENMKDDDES